MTKDEPNFALHLPSLDFRITLRLYHEYFQFHFDFNEVYVNSVVF